MSSVRLGRTVRGSQSWVVHSCWLTRRRTHGVHAARGAEGSTHVGTVSQLATRDPSSCTPFSRGSRYQIVPVNLTLRLTDLAQSWSGSVRTQRLQSDLVTMVASVCVRTKLQPTRERGGPHTLPDLSGAFEEQL